MEIEVFFPGGKRVYARYGGFVVQTDQPIDEGGEGTAPSPLGLFFVSIATCAGFYVLAFCQQRNIPTDDIGVLMHYEFDESVHLVRKVNLEIKLPKDFPQKYVNAVVSSAELCSVKRHLQNPPEIDITARVAD